MKNDLIEQFIPLANKLAYQRKKTVPSFIDIEDLRSAAYLGLVEAATRFNPDLGVKFSTFAYMRIFGAICDFLREENTCYTSENQNIRLTTDSNLEEMLEYLTINLTTKGKTIIKSYYIDNFSLREIGEKEGLSESRISQLIKKYKETMMENYNNLAA